MTNNNKKIIWKKVGMELMVKFLDLALCKISKQLS